MEIRCPTCGKAYQLDPSGIPPNGKKVRCKPCATIFLLHPDGRTEPVSVPAPSPAPTWSVRTPAGEEEGLPVEELRNRIRSGELIEEDEVLPPGFSEWQAAGSSELLAKWFRLRSRAPAPRHAAAAAPAAAPSGPRRADGQAVLNCRQHPQNLAKYLCAPCATYYCDCIGWKDIQTVRVAICPRCGEPLGKVAEQKVFTPFWKDIPRILLFSFRGPGWIYYLAGMFFWFGGKVFCYAQLVKVLVYIAMTLHIIRTAARGDNNFPDFPEVHDIWSDIVMPGIKATIVSLIVWIPLILYLVLLPGGFVQALSILVVGLTSQNLLPALGLLAIILVMMAYYPMVLAILAIWGTIVPALNPILVFRLIGRAKAEYVKMLAIFYPLLLLRLGAGIVVFFLTLAAPGAGYAGPAVIALVGLYVMFTSSHLLGRMCHENDEKFGWG